VNDGTYEVKLDIFEGPLDLLLYLIKKNEIDIYNIPIALITEQYLRYLEIMDSLNIDLAGEYLLMAATLLYIKSQMLLPQSEEEPIEEEKDPRTELVKQIVAYQAYKEAALKLNERPLLERDVFKRPPFSSPMEPTDGGTLIELDIFSLAEAFKNLMVRGKTVSTMEINGEKTTLAERMHTIMERLKESPFLYFGELIEEGETTKAIIYTFLAILELMKLRLIRAYQLYPFGPIRIQCI